MAHAHAQDGLSGRTRRRAVVLLACAVVPLAVATVVGLVALWPREAASTYLPQGARFLGRGVVERTAEVVGSTPFRCDDVGVEGDPSASRRGVCAHLRVRLDAPGRPSVRVDVDSTVVATGLGPGDRVTVLRLPAAQGQPVTYLYSDTERGLPLTLLAVGFVLAVLVVARLRGLLALLGLGLSLVVVVEFLLPALLVGRPPLLVGVVASAAIVFAVLYLAHGVSVRTTTALLGTLAGLGVAAGLGWWAVHAAHLTGVGSEDDLTVRAYADRVQLSGLLLAGIVIAGLGVLNDVTVTQASAVWELHALQPTASAARLFAGAMRIGRDHIASSVYTIVFVYAGSGLPVLLLITLYQRPLSATLTTEAIGQELVSTLVGAIALVLAVPLTTAVGVALVTASDRGPRHAPSHARSTT